MPAAHAHHSFGEVCIQNMPEKLQKICVRYRELFDFGVHGPDVLFYYHPLSSNEINKYGTNMHTWTGIKFFQECKKKYQDKGVAVDKNAMLAYLLGFLAHFTLDSCCHAYINEQTEQTPFSHNLIESQYEAYLMKKDGFDPLRINRSKTLKPNRERAAVIAAVLQLDEKKVLKSMRGQKRTLHLFYSPKEIKKKTIRRLIKTLKMKGDFGDLFLDTEVIPECEKMNEQIYKMQKKAERVYRGLLMNYIRYLYDKTNILDVHFRHDFEGIFHEVEDYGKK